MCQACSQSVSQVTHLCPLYRRVVHHVTSDTNGGEASTGTRTQAKLTIRNPAMVEVIMERGRCQGRNPNVSRAPSRADVKSSRPGCGVPLRRSSIVEPYRLRKHVHGSIPARHMPRDTLCRSEEGSHGPCGGVVGLARQLCPVDKKRNSRLPRK